MHVPRQHSIIINNSGFTLLEITLALLISALVLAMVYGSVKGVSGSIDSLSLRNELYRTNYALLEEMGRELSAAFRSRYDLMNPGRTRTYFYAENEEENGMQQGKLYFTTYGHALSPQPLGESDQSEICYEAQYDRTRDELIVLKKEDLATNEISCRDRDSFDRDHSNGQGPYVVATGIHPEKGAGYRLIGFEVIPVDTTQQGKEPSEPVKKWDTDNEITQKNRLPNTVKITLTYEGAKKDIIKFERTAWLQLGGLSTPAGQGQPTTPSPTPPSPSPTPGPDPNLF